MPDGQIAFLKQERLLSYEKIAGIVEILAEVGVRKVRLTGGEPLMRSSLENLVSLLARIPKVEEIALTTNAMLLANQAARLFEAGLKRVQHIVGYVARIQFSSNISTRRTGQGL